jgi:hypothetical protein
MTRQIGQMVTDGPVAMLEARVHALEERVSTIAEAVRLLAHALEDVPTAEPAERPVAEAARRAYELLLAEAHRPGTGASSAPERTNAAASGPQGGEKA